MGERLRKNRKRRGYSIAAIFLRVLRQNRWRILLEFLRTSRLLPPALPHPPSYSGLTRVSMPQALRLYVEGLFHLFGAEREFAAFG
ncbi:hypothetical protein AMK06_CH01082 [Rhizobium sp. N541]|nr:hypothetical protein AMK05_CH01123 [Rhizobium sp. N324]ANM16019.1 hypothetical protein AMK06_CH01082 [Rhizobium sp. N541]ANM22407.1 hypothetical protein AMK07_CH01082 [Rhizobium sp. N941]OYD03117.1 hypothetical protein AMK08_CH101118 [Rhizobium sp. N4311]